MATHMLILYDSYLILAFLEEGHVVLHQAEELVHVLHLLLTFDVHLQAANVVLLHASAIARGVPGCNHAHADGVRVVHVLLGVVAFAAQHLAGLPLLDLMIRRQIQF